MTLASAAAGGSPWTWHPHPDVFLLLGGAVLAYFVALRRLGPRHAPAGGPPASRWQVTSFLAGVLILWVGAASPVHDIAEQYLFSMHMVQHTLFSLVAPALLLLGTPRWLAELVVRPRAVAAVVGMLGRSIPSLVLFNVVIVVLHWAPVVDLALRSEPAHFALHLLLFSSALLVWMPVASPLARPGRITPPAQMLHLFVNSIVPTVPASFFTFSEGVIYERYGAAPRIWGMTAIADQQMAGLIMKLGGAAILWGAITIIFFRWQVAEEEAERIAARERRGAQRNIGSNGAGSLTALGAG